MTLIEVIDILKETAKTKPNIGYVCDGDIYVLNSTPNIEYSVFFITQGSHSLNYDDNTITYNLNLFYVDRLTETFDNRLIVQSNGIVALNNIINDFIESNEDVVVDGNISFTSFNQRFADDCCGVFCQIGITVKNEIGLCSYE